MWVRSQDEKSYVISNFLMRNLEAVSLLPYIYENFDTAAIFRLSDNDVVRHYDELIVKWSISTFRKVNTNILLINRGR